MTADLRHFNVRPSIGTHRVDLTCKRCGGLVRDERLNGLSTVADLVDAANGHEQRMHRPNLVITIHQGGAA